MCFFMGMLQAQDSKQEWIVLFQDSAWDMSPNISWTKASHMTEQGQQVRQVTLPYIVAAGMDTGKKEDVWPTDAMKSMEDHERWLQGRWLG